MFDACLSLWPSLIPEIVSADINANQQLAESRESVQYSVGVSAVSILSALFYLDYLAFTVQVSFYSRDLGLDTDLGQIGVHALPCS